MEKTARNAFDDRELQELSRSLRLGALLRGADDQTADDVVQETWLRALQRPPKDAGRIRGWLHVVARRYLRQLRGAERYRRQRERLAARPETILPVPADDASLLVRRVDELPQPYRGVIRLRFLEGLEVEEIAERLARPPETVRSQLKRGLERLRVRLHERQGRGLERLLWLGWLLAILAGKRERTAASDSRRLALPVLAAAGLITGWSLWALFFARVERTPDVALAVVDAPAPEPTWPVPARRERIEPYEAPALDASPRALPWILSGTVRTPEGAPVPGALVRAGAATSQVESRSVLADVGGRYRIQVEPHDLVWASQPGWCDSRRSYAACVSDRDDVDLFLAPAGRELVVQFLTSTGAPVEDALVYLDPGHEIERYVSERGGLEFVAPNLPTRTDEHGRVRLDVPPGESVSLAILPSELPAWSGELPIPESPEPLTVKLPRATPLRATCTDEEGRPAANARVEVLQRSGLVRREALTSADGTFEIDTLGTGEFVVRVLEDPTSGCRSARFEGILQEGEPLELGRLVLTSGTTIRGILRGQGTVAGALVTLQPHRPGAAEGELARRALSDGEGRFVFGGCGFAEQQVLRVHAPGEDQPRIEEIILEPDGEERTYDLDVDQAKREPVTVRFLGPLARGPRWIELRRGEPSMSVVLEPEEGSELFRSRPLLEGRYNVIAWFPDHGPWLAGSLEHRLGPPATHDFSLPEPARLRVELTLPDGVRPETVEVFVQVPAFNCFGIGQFGKQKSLLKLRRDGERASYSAEVLPGSTKVVVRGASLAELRKDVEIAAGERKWLQLTPTPGVRTRILFLSPRPPRPGEILHVIARYPTESMETSIPPRLQRRTQEGFEVVVWLPLSITELRVFTDQSHQFESLAESALEATREFGPGELQQGEGMPCLTIQLVEVQK